MKEGRILVPTKIGAFVAAQFTGNHSGMTVMGEEVLVLCDRAPEQTKGGIIMPTTVQDSNSMAAQTGVIVAIGDDAWRWNRSRTREFTGRRPAPGDRIVFQRYAGINQIGLDEVEYRIMSDISINAIFTAAEEGSQSNAA